MPEISRFYGIVIRIFFEAERHQLPHLHAVFGEHLASFSIDPPALLAGTMPRRQMHLILAWIELHQDELLTDWELARLQLPLNRIRGLE
jgi:hypothetical protein